MNQINKNWANFKEHFVEAHNESMQDDITSSGQGYSANFVNGNSENEFMQDTYAALANLADSTQTNRTAMDALIQSNMQLVATNAMLTAELQTALQIIKNLKTNRTSVKDKDKYCWLCGFQKVHKSAECTQKKPRHKDEAIASNRMDGSVKNKRQNSWLIGASIKNKINCDLNSNFATGTPPYKTTCALADTGTSGHYVAMDVPLTDMEITSPGLEVTVSNKSSMTSTHSGFLNLHADLPREATKAYKFRNITHSLISIGQLCKYGCKAIFDADKLHIHYKGKLILTGIRNPSSNMWVLPINAPAQPRANHA